MISSMHGNMRTFRLFLNFKFWEIQDRTCQDEKGEEPMNESRQNIM